ncbi:MAG: hypothetical protein EZS28_025370, partial [Streblomastix strix]
MPKITVSVMIIIIHFIFCANCHVALYVNRAYNPVETAEVLKPQRQTAQQKGSQLLTFFSYSNVTVIENMNFTVYSNADNENSPNFEIHQEFDSQPLEHVTIQESSIQYEEVQFIGHDYQKDTPQILENDSNTLTQHDNTLSGELGKPVLLKFVNEVNIAMCNSSIINFIRIIFVAVQTRAIMTAFLPRKIVNLKFKSLQQKNNSNKLVILLLIIAYHSIFEVTAVSHNISNTDFDGKSQNIVVDQPTDEFKVINCKFRKCGQVGTGYGGALNIKLSNKGKCWILNSTFTNCSTYYGGAIYAYVRSGGELTINGLCSFTDCHSQIYGSALYAIIDGQNCKLLLEDGLKFEKCTGNLHGGGIYLEIGYPGNAIINKVSFIDCEESQYGGGMHIYDISPESQKLNGTLFQRCNANTGGGLYIGLGNEEANIELISITFIGCHATSGGGGLYIYLYNGGQVSLQGQCLFQDCSSYYGGGMLINAQQYLFEINNAQFKNCSCPYQGGGLHASIESGGKLIIDSCQFIQCNGGNGGGIYINIDFSTQSSFIIKDTIFQECRAQNNNSQKYSQSGFGGGLFLGALGDYDPNSKLIDLHGMKIYNNTADKYGQSLYVAMTKVVEWCQYGILGEYVKGNYSDRYSNENDLEGIPMNLSTFNSSSLQTIEQQQKPLEHWWMFGILQSAQVVVNVSNPDGKLIFHIEGQRMIQGYLNVKIIELRDKTQEEIDQEQKQFKSNLKQNNLNFTKENSSVKDGSSAPISIEGEIESNQKATFGMNEYKWLNYKEKVYGVLISNDRNRFTGKDGIDIQDDSNVAVPLEVIIDEEDVDDVLGILQSAYVIVNVSNPDGKLIFHIGGQRMIQGYLNVKIFELRDKTQEELDQEYKEIKYKHNKNNLKSLKRNSLQSQISPKHQTINQQQISISTNLKIKQKLLLDQTNEIIYPPEDGSSAPISIEGEIESDQKATFGMNEYKWLNYKEKVYGVLISNDRNRFTG